MTHQILFTNESVTVDQCKANATPLKIKVTVIVAMTILDAQVSYSADRIVLSFAAEVKESVPKDWH